MHLKWGLNQQRQFKLSSRALVWIFWKNVGITIRPTKTRNEDDRLKDVEVCGCRSVTNGSQMRDISEVEPTRTTQEVEEPNVQLLFDIWKSKDFDNCILRELNEKKSSFLFLHVFCTTLHFYCKIKLKNKFQVICYWFWCLWSVEAVYFTDQDHLGVVCLAAYQTQLIIQWKNLIQFNTNNLLRVMWFKLFHYTKTSYEITWF